MRVECFVSPKHKYQFILWDGKMLSKKLTTKYKFTVIQFNNFLQIKSMCILFILHLTVDKNDKNV